MKSSKKRIFYITFILLIILSVISAAYFCPRKFNKEYRGVVYRLGDNAYSENIKISFDGYLSKRLFKGDKFQGVIIIGDKKLIKVNMQFDSSDRAHIEYYDESLSMYNDYGDIVSSNIKGRFTICVLEADKNNSGSTWSIENGLMVSAPANSRSEALDISKSILGDKELK